MLVTNTTLAKGKQAHQNSTPLDGIVKSFTRYENSIADGPLCFQNQITQCSDVSPSLLISEDLWLFLIFPAIAVFLYPPTNMLKALRSL